MYVGIFQLNLCSRAPSGAIQKAEQSSCARWQKAHVEMKFQVAKKNAIV